MTIEKEPPGVWFITCDLCQERVELETDPDDRFMQAAYDSRKLGWRLKQVTGYRNRVEWINICPDCQDEEKAKILKEAGLN